MMKLMVRNRCCAAHARARLGTDRVDLIYRRRRRRDQRMSLVSLSPTRLPSSLPYHIPTHPTNMPQRGIQSRPPRPRPQPRHSPRLQRHHRKRRGPRHDRRHRHDPLGRLRQRDTWRCQEHPCRATGSPGGMRKCG